MKSFKLITLLSDFLKTGNVLSDDNIFNVNNIKFQIKNSLKRPVS